METSVIGQGPLTLHEVSLVIEKSTSFPILQARWRLFAVYIGVNDAELPGIERRINLGTLQLKEVPREVLRIWKADQGPNATFNTLCKALDKCDLNDIADTLTNKFSSVRVETLPIFVLQEKLYSLEGLFESNVPKPIFQLAKSHWQVYTPTEPIPIIRQEVCHFDLPSPCYIPRTLSWRNQLDEKLLTAEITKHHIFLVKGATKPELARASGFKPIEKSGNQLERVTARHILLESEDDFDAICKNTTNPVHMIEFKGNYFFHLNSVKGIQTVHSFVKDTCVFFDEDDAVQQIAKTNSPAVLCIADSPGMGKTFLLAKLSTQIKETYPNSINLFIVLQELAQTMTPSQSAIEVISNYATTNDLTKLIFHEILKNNKYQFYLFLDGYDEVSQDKLHLVDSLLRQLTRFSYIKTIITTRAHLTHRLENISQRFSYEILPFNESNQIDFLTKYWSSKCLQGAENGETLRLLAQKCLQALKENMTSTESDIAGIPLQCSMLAEVYAAQAKRAAKLKVLPDDGVITTSFFEMYKLLMEIKFKRIGNSLELRKKYRDAHVYDSIALLFPDWLERFKKFLYPREGVDEVEIYSIGLIEKSPSSNTPRFQHRTFAENLLAQFLVWNLEKNATCIACLYTEIFGAMGTTNTGRYNLSSGFPKMYELKHTVIAYFIDMHLQDRSTSNDHIDYNSLSAHDLTEVSSEDLCIAANACCGHGLENCFDLTKVILKKINIKRQVDLQNKYFKDLPHLVVERTENSSMLKKVLNFTTMELEVNHNWHIVQYPYQFINFFQIPNCTPLHVAVYHGKYNMVILLLQKYGEDVLSIMGLMHCCLNQSSKNSDSIIEDKVSIIESLKEINPEWLEEKLHGRKPILQVGIHLKLLQYMVQLGIDINTSSPFYGTILHSGGDKSTYADLVRWALNNGFTLINHVDENGLSPLMRAIKWFGVLGEDVLRLFYDGGANFNAKDKEGNSVLICAIQSSGSVDFVRHVLDLGANMTHTNMRGDNAAHIVIKYLNEPDLALDFLKLLESRGFTGLLEKNNEGATPVNLAVRGEIRDDKLLDYLLEAGPDEDGNTALFQAVQYAQNGILIQGTLRCGANVNRKNTAGENAAHLVIKYHHKNPQLVLQLLKLLDFNGFTVLHERDNAGITPINLAMCRGSTDEKLLKYFVSAGEDTDGNSALFYALMYANENQIKKLLSIGENVNRRNNVGDTAAHIVLMHHYKNPQLALELLRLIESHGFNGFNQKDISGMTPFEQARDLEVTDVELLKYLSDRN